MTRLSSTFIAGLLALTMFPLKAYAAPGMLQGGVETRETIQGKKTKPSPYKGNVESEADPFSGVDRAVAPEPEREPPVQEPVFDPGPFGQEDSPGLGPSGSPLSAAIETEKQVDQVDPDDTEEMRLAWDVWHHRVAQEIFVRFNTIAKSAFRYSPPLQCRVHYVVTSAGQVQNVQIQQKSSNMMFNLLIMTVLKSINGDTALLRFPEGSRRTWVGKEGDFLQNTGAQGFRYTLGDSETYRTKR